jgi:hypothetical protein
MGRKLSLAIALSATIAVLLSGLGATASTTSDESYFVSHINAERANRGLNSLSVAQDLVAVARQWSAQMASDGAISHDPNLPNEVSNWTVLGDNVGRGATAADLHRAFMDSPSHRDNILDSRFTHVGIGVVDAGDKIYVTEVFVRRVSGTTSPRRTVRRTVTHHTTAPATPSPTRYDSEVDVTGVVWEVSLGPRPLTLEYLQQLNQLDAR